MAFLWLCTSYGFALRNTILLWGRPHKCEDQNNILIYRFACITGHTHEYICIRIRICVHVSMYIRIHTGFRMHMSNKIFIRYLLICIHSVHKEMYKYNPCYNLHSSSNKTSHVLVGHNKPLVYWMFLNWHISNSSSSTECSNNAVIMILWLTIGNRIRNPQ